jgi:hypothetical protein
MKKPRAEMSVRRVRQGSVEAGDSRVGGTMNERLVTMSQLSISAWANTGRPFPHYSRSEIPVFKTTLGARSDRD